MIVYKRLKENLEFKCPYELGGDSKYPTIYKNELCIITERNIDSDGFSFTINSLERIGSNVRLKFDDIEKARLTGYPV